MIIKGTDGRSGRKIAVDFEKIVAFENDDGFTLLYANHGMVIKLVGEFMGLIIARLSNTRAVLDLDKEGF